MTNNEEHNTNDQPNFKNWLASQPEFVSDLRYTRTTPSYKGVSKHPIEARIGSERLARQIESHNTHIAPEKAQELADKFIKLGGMMVETKDLNVVIEVSAERFYLPKLYTKPLSR